MGGPGDAAGYQRELERAVQEKGLTRFYPPGSRRIQAIAARASQQVDNLCRAWHIQKEIANDIVRLALYDVIIYIDDSGSMSFEENGERIKDLHLILQRVSSSHDSRLLFRTSRQNEPQQHSESRMPECRDALAFPLIPLLILLMFAD